MKTIITILIIGVIIVGCVGREVVKSEPRKHFQMKNPINGEVIMQVDLQNESACKWLLSAMKTQTPTPKGSIDLVYCSTISASSSPPFRARAREKS